MITGKFVKDFNDDFFEDIDLTCLTFLSSINIDARHNVYQYLYTTFYNYELVYEPTLLKRFIEDKIWENADMLNHLYETTQYDYNPIWNKDGTITETREIETTDSSTLTGTETSSNQKTTGLSGTKVIDRDTTDTGTVGNQGTEQETLAQTGTDTVAETGTDTLRRTGTETTDKTGTDTTVETGTDTSTHTGTDTILHTGTDNTSTSQSGTSKTSDYPMNVSSGTGKPRQYQETSTSGTNNNTKNLSDAETKNLTDTETKNLTTTKTLDLEDETTLNTSDTETKNLTTLNTKNLTDTKQGQNSNTETRNLAGTEDIRETNQEQGSETSSGSGSTSQSKSGSGTQSETYERVEQGNIGVTSTQQLIKEEREIILVMYTKIVSLISDFFYLNVEWWG